MTKSSFRALHGRRGGSHVGTLVERRSRYLLLLHLPDGAGTDSVIAALTAAMHQLPPLLRRPVTWDRGIEMTRHHVYTAHTGVLLRHPFTLAARLEREHQWPAAAVLA